MGTMRDGYTPAENIEEADRLVMEGGVSLLRWLDEEGLTVLDADFRPIWGNMMLDWKELGVEAAGKAWVTKAKKGLLKHGVTERERVASKIAVKFVGARMRKSAGEVRPSGRSSAGTEHILPHVLWVLRHPMMRIREEKGGCCDKCERPFMDPVLVAQWQEYERENPAPNDLASALLLECRLDRKLYQDLLTQSSKPVKQQTAEPVGAGETKGSGRLVDLEAELAGMGTAKED